jgi:threonyl-tRNA synthetase
MANPILSTASHSVAHLMAAAVGRHFEGVQYGVGPVIDSGCYYDFILPRPFVPEDLAAISATYQELLGRDLRFERQELPLKEAIALFTALGQPLKVELLKDLEKYGTTRLDEQSREAFAGSDDAPVITTYALKDPESGEVLFEDLCRGPHVESVAELRELGTRADKFSAAYWRGDQERGISMQRLYTLVFPDPAALEEYVHLREEAQKRDHRQLGRDLELYFFHDSAPGIPYWLPKGKRLKNLLIQYWRQYHEPRGYAEVESPLLNKKELWETSGHWEHYKDDMFLTRSRNEETWGIKPMNCPNAMVIFGQKTRSYKDLPLRLSDVDTLHRDEIPGALHGLMRARAFAQDDSHNFVTETQIKEEVQAILTIVRDFYGIFGLLDNVKLNLATRPDDFMGDIESWDRAERELKEVLESSGFSFGIKEKDGAFYGPKIDIHLFDALKREWQCGTIQLDFQLPRKFALQYTAEDGSLQTPVVIHRVIYGSLERFIGILTEHFAGRFPYWFAPVQVKVLTLNDQMAEYAAKVRTVLDSVVLDAPVRYNPLRYEMDNRSESLGRKIRDAEQEKIPVILIIGPKDQAAGEVSLRTRNGESKISLDSLGNYLNSYQD